MNLHILMLVNSYAVANDPRHGAALRRWLGAMRQRGWRCGLAALHQQHYDAIRCLRGAGVVEEEEFGAPVLRNCTLHSLVDRFPLIGRLPWLPILSMQTIRRYIRRHGRPDLIHAYGAQWPGLAASIIRERTGIPYVLREHMSNFVAATPSEAMRPALEKALAGAVLRLPISQAVGERLEAHFGQIARPWRVLPNMIDPLFTERRLTPMPDTAPVTFVAVGRLAPIKRIDLLLRAFAQAFATTDERLRLVGDGAERTALEALARELGLAERAEFLGAQEREEVARLIESSHALALSSDFETFSNPVIEAQTLGRPVVATRCGGPESFITEQNGILADRDNVEALSTGLQRLRDHIKDYDAAAIRRDCLARFDPDMIMDQLAQAYLDAMEATS